MLTLGLSRESIASSEIRPSHATANNCNALEHLAEGAFPQPLHEKLLSGVSHGVVRLNSLELV